MNELHLFILAGGKGTRLAPLSLTGPGKLPKQFLRLVSEKTLLQNTIERVEGLGEITVITDSDYESEARSQVENKANILAEPFGCDTTAAITYALNSLPSDSVCVFMPADHIMDKEIFRSIIAQAQKRAAIDEKIITLGISPDRPETGYGYIKTQKQDSGFNSVERFVEKPNLETAKTYVESGEYFWNSGVFCFKRSVMMPLIKKNAPLIWDAFQNKNTSQAYKQILEAKMNKSIDFTVMENEPESIILYPSPVTLGWNDVGGWPALKRYIDSDANGNTSYGEVRFKNCSNCQVMNYLPVKIHVSDLKETLVVSTENGIVIVKNEDAPRIKEIIPEIKSKKHRSLMDSENIQIKSDHDLFIGVMFHRDMNITFEKTLQISRI